MHDGWYFTSREGDNGPFLTEAQANDEVLRFIYEKHELDHFQRAREAENNKHTRKAKPPRRAKRSRPVTLPKLRDVNI